jgi:D-beta-D-heptose 7-phosphate kinase / D-beta-D-heptose 1-phosphate adenosyltransferase
MINILNSSPNILVIGDLMIDEYLWGSCDRISPEAPVQIINIESKNSVLGGAGNVVNNLKKLGANVDIISIIGDCKISMEIKNLFKDIEVATDNLIIQKNRISSKKTRVIASQQQVIRYDSENSDDISSKSQKSVLEAFNKIVKKYDVILLSDYGKGLLTEHVTKSIIKTANNNYIRVVVDPKGKNYSKYKGAYALTPNKKEAGLATNIDIVDEKSLINALKKLKTICELDISLITLSESGVAIYDNKFRMHPTKGKEVFDVTGAGDTILASLGFAFANGLNIDDSVQFSNLAAGVVVSKIGSATATLDEIINHDQKAEPLNSFINIKSISEIIALSKKLKANNKKIVFTNGCFDLLHAGHISYLETAKSFGDILIVGLNSDHSVKNLKGKDRPINSQEDRACLLTALKAVDYVVIFNDETPYEIIKTIKPNVLVKGGDYKNQIVVGQDIVDELKLVQFVKDKGTTKIIKKIRQS